MNVRIYLGSTILDTGISFEKAWLLCCNEKGVAQSASYAQYREVNSALQPVRMYVCGRPAG